MRIFFITALCCLLSFPVYATPDFSIDLALDHVDITTSFSGTEVVIYGSKPTRGDIALTLQGPPRPMIVWKKEKNAGLWINTQSMIFRNVPSYYDFAASLPENELSSNAQLASLEIGLNALDFSPAYEMPQNDMRSFEEALIRNKQEENIFPLQPQKIEYINDNFFKVTFTIPPQLPKGSYLVEAFLFQNQKLISRQSEKLEVVQVGLNARLSHFARDHGFLYGVFSVFLALLAGWAAYQAGRRA